MLDFIPPSPTAIAVDSSSKINGRILQTELEVASPLNLASDFKVMVIEAPRTWPFKMGVFHCKSVVGGGMTEIFVPGGTLL